MWPFAAKAEADLLGRVEVLMAESTPRGTFVWHDLMTKDAAAAIEFYMKVAGWGTQ